MACHCHRETFSVTLRRCSGGVMRLVNGARCADFAPAACAQKYQHLFQVNEAQGSFYLQSKVPSSKPYTRANHLV